MKKSSSLLVGALVLSFSLLQTLSADPIVIDVIPNSKNPMAPPSLYISEQPVTPEAYCAFLNAVASTNDPHGLYHPEWNDVVHYPNLFCISRSGDPQNGFTYNLVNQETNVIMTTNGIPITKINPITQQQEVQFKKLAKRTIMKGVPMTDAARFCNWMSQNQPIGPEGDSTTETGSYTFCETNNYGTSGMILLAQENGNDTITRELKEVYKSVTRTPGATWRLPDEGELMDVIFNWGEVDIGEVFWCWTDTIYPHCWKTKLAGISLSFNGAGYRRIKNQPEIFTDRTKLYIYQDLSVSDTGFRVVFSADRVPVSGFRVFVPSATLPSNPTQ